MSVDNYLLPELQQIKTEYRSFNNFNNERLFNLLIIKYYINENKLDHSDFTEYVTDGKDDGGIDLLHRVDEKLVLSQCKFISNLQNTQDLIDMVNKIDETINDLENHDNQRLNAIVKNRYYETISSFTDDVYDYEINLYVGCEISEPRKREFERRIEEKELKSNIANINLFDLLDIEKRIDDISSKKSYVKEDKVFIEKAHGKIEFDDCGLLVNIRASSIKRLFDRYKDNGLFEQNFRYYIKNKRIDDDIIHSIKNESNEFWYLNNGIIIGCSDFRSDGDNVKLYDFSIVNGCQTSTLIGLHFNSDNDFHIPCKIVKSQSGDGYDEFISKIAKSSNSQKPISVRDLKSNRPEMRQLQNKLLRNSPKVAMEIKRGEKLLKPSEKREMSNWQVLKNDYLAQVIYSFFFQYPGLSHSAKKKLFETERLYKQIFKRAHNIDALVDALILFDYYDHFYKDLLETEDALDNLLERTAKYSRFVIPALIGFLLRARNNLIDNSVIMNHDKDIRIRWLNDLHKDCQSCIFINKANYEYDEYQKRLFSLFRRLVIFIKNQYEKNNQQFKTINALVKSDQNYVEKIIIPFYQEKMKDAYEWERYIDDLDYLFTNTY